MIEEIKKDVHHRMDAAVESVRSELAQLRTGKASPAILDGIVVNYYGTPTPLRQAANVSAPEPRLLVIQPWDRSLLGEIEKAILKSELGLTPMNDGKVIRISIPTLTQERRKELMKVIKKMAEEAKDAMRNIRRDTNEMLKDLKKEKEISEDEQFKAQDETQKITDDFIKKVDSVYSAKEKEILEI